MAGGEPKLLSVEDAADILELSEPGIKQMIYRDKLKAEKAGNQWVIRDRDLASVKDRRSVGRPPKAEMENK
jgi:excisionase family DNA binding protein